MGRNKLIYALSDLTVVVAGEEATGGTRAGATETSVGALAGWLFGAVPAKAQAMPH